VRHQAGEPARNLAAATRPQPVTPLAFNEVFLMILIDIDSRAVYEWQ
jgi:hypothetical protein